MKFSISATTLARSKSTPNLPFPHSITTTWQRQKGSWWQGWRCCVLPRLTSDRAAMAVVGRSLRSLRSHFHFAPVILPLTRTQILPLNRSHQIFRRPNRTVCSPLIRTSRPLLRTRSPLIRTSQPNYSHRFAAAADCNRKRAARLWRLSQQYHVDCTPIHNAIPLLLYTALNYCQLPIIATTSYHHLPPTNTTTTSYFFSICHYVNRSCGATSWLTTNTVHIVVDQTKLLTIRDTLHAVEELAAYAYH